jgi:hypothetical protein
MVAREEISARKDHSYIDAREVNVTIAMSM